MKACTKAMSIVVRTDNWVGRWLDEEPSSFVVASVVGVVEVVNQETVVVVLIEDVVGGSKNSSQYSPATGMTSW